MDRTARQHFGKRAELVSQFREMKSIVNGSIEAQKRRRFVMMAALGVAIAVLACAVLALL